MNVSYEFIATLYFCGMLLIDLELINYKYETVYELLNKIITYYLNCLFLQVTIFYIIQC